MDFRRPCLREHMECFLGKCRCAVLNSARQPVFFSSEVRQYSESLEINLDLCQRAVRKDNPAMAGSCLNTEFAETFLPFKGLPETVQICPQFIRAAVLLADLSYLAANGYFYTGRLYLPDISCKFRGLLEIRSLLLLNSLLVQVDKG